MADPFNITLASIPLLEILREVSGSLKDYRRAPEQIDHALLLRKILESDNTQSSNISSTQLQEALASARKSLSEISESFLLYSTLTPESFGSGGLLVVSVNMNNHSRVSKK
jgi:hypothetical protein